ncbi:hypothetical protein E3W66_08950 [Gammaproteobacteria bacterium LSUCC0057]|uniref:Uncharacterized protein n=1 Tax=Gammaproteobacteria bacterium LSUCC0057 TaxID=2559237 RepID=A0A4Y8UGT2_9GAMM|nr:hypothetical protein E3W66_08950 [Gammaproteobacteria bacterium LSUCC0057]
MAIAKQQKAKLSSWRQLAVLALFPALFIDMSRAEDVDTTQLEEAIFLIRQRQFVPAVKLLTPLANQGNNDARFRLAALYQRGSGVTKSLQHAFELLNKACQHQHPASCKELSRYYEYGRGTNQSISAALQTLEKAAAAGATVAERDLRRLREQLKKTYTIDELQVMIVQQQTETFKTALTNQPLFYQQLLTSGHSLLSYAISNKEIWAVELLLQQSDPNLLTGFGQPPLTIAVLAQSPAAVGMLAAQGANINGRDSLGNCPLHHAVRIAGEEIINLLLQLGANPNCRNNAENSPFDLTAESDRAIRQLLSQYGAKKTTAVKQAYISEIERNNTALEALDALDDTPYAQWQPLNVAAWLGSSAVVERLIDSATETGFAQAFVNQTDSTGFTPLMRAAMRGHSDVVAILLNYGASVMTVDPQGLTAFDHALRTDSLATITLLLQKTEQSSNQSLLRLLQHAAVIGSDDVLLAIIRQAQPLSRDFDSSELSVLLNTMASQQRVKSATALLQSLPKHAEKQTLSVILNKKDSLQRSTLWWLLHYRFIETALLFHQAGSELGQADHQGVTPLHLLAAVANEQQLQQFEITEAIINDTDQLGSTALMEAAQVGNVAAIIWLLEQGADVGMRNTQSLTALMIAARNGHIDAAKILIASGANPSKRNKEGLNAAALAARAGFDSLSQYLHSL